MILRFSLRASLLVGLVATAACGGVTQFSGGQPFAITGSPPAVVEKAPEPRVELRDNKLELKEKIQFEVNKATIKSESFALLHEIAEVIKKNPQVKKISIEGHASADGDPKPNLKLSNNRARAVRKHLIKRENIPATALMARGWGEDKPVSDNETAEGREANRRVEFLVVEQDVTTTKVEIDPKTGAEKVIDEKKDTLTADLSGPPDISQAPKGKKRAKQ